MEFKDGNIHDLISFFNLTEKQIKYFAFNKGSGKLYKKYKIPKRNGGFRLLRAPCHSLKIIQKKILDDILYSYDHLLSDMITGFRMNKSIVNNAIIHKNKQYILKLDIQDFFPSISKDRVFGLFYRTFDFSYEVAAYIAGICTYKNELPQGAPSSPMIANFIARTVDYRIIGLLKKYNQLDPLYQLSYSRYADDITISFSKSINLDKFITILDEILNQEGFILNPRKIKLISANYNQTVTGITVNKKISLGKHTHKKWRAIAHTILYKGWHIGLQKWNIENNLNLDLNEYKSIINGYRYYFSMILDQSEQESLTLKTIVKDLTNCQLV